MEATGDRSAFTAVNLRRYKAVVFVNTSGAVLADGGRAASEAFVAAGRGWLGVHLAAGAECDWPWYGRLVGARFDQHPKVQEATFAVTERTSSGDEWNTIELAVDGARPVGT